MQPTPIGVDIARSVFQIHDVDPDTGEIVNRTLKRAKFLEFFANRKRSTSGTRTMRLTHEPSGLQCSSHARPSL
jgi:hypothetical protein